MKVLVVVLACVVLIFPATGILGAQTATSQVTGTVADQTGAAVAGAQVTIINTDTNYTRQVMTDQSGAYVLPNLPIGPYRLEVTAMGFQTFVQTAIVLKVDVNPTINVAMVIGQVSQQVEVEASAIQVETTSTGVGQVINHDTVLDMPLNGRQITSLVLLAPAVTECNNCNGGFTGVRQYPVIGYQVAGGSPGGTYFSMDGSSHNDPGNNLNMAVPFPDALQEFHVETGAVPARYGQHANADVTIVTKSGTNSFHGDAFEFVRNGFFNAQNMYAPEKDPLKRNQFGGILGGPIKKDKLFFFAGYQGTIVRSIGTVNGSGTIVNDFIPTAAMLQGNFQAYASPACNSGKQVTLKAPTGSAYQFVNNMINPLAFSSVSLAYLKYFPVSTNQCGNYILDYPIPSTDEEYDGRLDYQRSDKQSMFVRYFRAEFVQQSPNALTPGNGADAVADYLDNGSYSLVFGHTYIFSPNLINSFHATYLDEPNDRTPSAYLNPTQAGAAIYSTPFGGPSTTMNVTPGFGLGGTAANNAVFNYQVFGFSDDIDMIHGAHQISFGIQYLFQTEFTHSTQYSNGVMTFNGQETGLALADFLLGDMENYQQGGDVYIHDRKPYLGLYVQDGWKVNRRLTLNLGVRWEPAFPIINADNHVMTFSPTLFAQNVHSSVYTNAPPGFQFPGDPGYPGQGMAPGDLKVFSPRVGLIFDPSGQGKEAIRAAYGVFVDSQPLFDNIYVGSNPPWGALVSINNVSLNNPWSNYAGGDPFPFNLTSNITFPLAGVYRVQQPHMNPEYTQQWNLSFEKQLKGWLVAVNYVGNESVHLWSAVDINAPVGATSTASEQAHRPYNTINPTWGPYISQMVMDNTGGTAHYDGLILSANKAFTHQFSVIANYTYSHCLNDFDPHQNTSSSDLDPYNIAYTYGNCSGDIRHVLKVSAVAQTPKFNSRWLERFAGNWQLSPIFTAETGYFESVTSGVDNAFDGISGQYADLVPGVSPHLANPTPTEWFNTAAYTKNAPGTYGDSGRNSIEGPGFWDLDLALSRNFPLRNEARYFQFRAEEYNIMNHPALGLPVSALNSATFGQINTAGDPRIMQFAMKFVF